jgi:hypothetical protein
MTSYSRALKRTYLSNVPVSKHAVILSEAKNLSATPTLSIGWHALVRVGMPEALREKPLPKSIGAQACPSDHSSV